MGVWKNTSIRNRLMVLIMAGSVVGLLLAGTAFLVYDRYFVMGKTVEELLLLAAVTAERNRGALVFSDVSLSESGLDPLRERANIEAACVYDKNDQLLSSLKKKGKKDRQCPPFPEKEAVRVGKGSVEIFEPVVLNGKQIGTLYVYSNLDEIDNRFRRYGVVILSISVVVALFTFFLSFLLQRGISLPLLRLSGTAGIIADRQDYSVRAAGEQIVELQVLVNAFNRMLATIEEQNLGLQKKKEELGMLVRERTMELEKKTQRLEEADRLKSEFLSSVTHELKTPLNSIIGFSRQVVKKSGHALPERQQHNMERVERNAAHLLDLINELLEFSRLETGKVLLGFEGFCLPSFVNELVEEFGASAREKSITLLSGDSDINMTVVSDREKLRSICSKLLGNAIKFTPPGGSINVEFGRAEKEAGGTSLPKKEGWFFISFKDTGPGISKEQQKEIFDGFRQADGSLERRAEGMGVGLAVATKLVALLSGRLELKSEEGKGSLFTVFFPVERRVSTEKGIPG
ncbi:MAG: ATP-binding protein [Nitrospinota bacterium]